MHSAAAAQCSDSAIRSVELKNLSTLSLRFCKEYFDADVSFDLWCNLVPSSHDLAIELRSACCGLAYHYSASLFIR